MGTFPKLDENLEEIPDEKMNEMLEEMDRNKFGQCINRETGESYEKYCKRVLDLYLANLGNIKEPEFYGENQDEASDEENNSSMIQYLCHMYAFGLERLHLQNHDPIDFEEFAAFFRMLAECLRKVVQVENPDFD